MKWIYLPWSARALPELSHLPVSDRTRAFEAARRDLGWRRNLGIGATLAMGVGLVTILAVRYAGLSGNYLPFSIGMIVYSVCILAWRATSDRASVRHLRRVNVFCVACGYDLRATPDRCPECGTVSATAKGNAEAQRRGGAEKILPREGRGR